MGGCSWYHFYTLSLMFGEKGDCDCISFSLDTDDKIEKINQSKHHWFWLWFAFFLWFSSKQW